MTDKQRQCKTHRQTDTMTDNDRQTDTMADNGRQTDAMTDNYRQTDAMQGTLTNRRNDRQ